MVVGPFGKIDRQTQHNGRHGSTDFYCAAGHCEDVLSALRQERSSRLRELDGWRAISALLVVFHHIGADQHPHFFSRVWGAVPLLDYWGPLAVRIFFVISGFVICRLLLLEELSFGSVSLKAFYYRRACRILPPLYTYLAVLSILLGLGLIRDSWHALFGAALFLTDIRHLPFSFPHSWFIAHTWSLAIEEQFYLIFPTLFVLTPKVQRRTVCLGVFILTVLWNLSVAYHDWDWITSSQTREGFACLSCGVLMAVYETRARHLAKTLSWYVAVIVAFILFLPPIWKTGFGAALYQSLFVPVAIALVLMSSLERGPLLRPFLCCKPMQAIGATSYGIYLWQQLFTAPKTFTSLAGPVPYFSASGQAIPMFLPLLGLIVPASYLLVEKPAMRLGKGLTLRARQQELVEVLN